jgi:PBP1b-binding outer membrane lipoprotein LpoB
MKIVIALFLCTVYITGCATSTYDKYYSTPNQCTNTLYIEICDKK